MSENTKTSWKGPQSRHLWILCLFPVAKINTRSPNVALNLVVACVQTSPISFVARGKGTKEIGDVCTQATWSSLREVFNLVFAAFCDSRKTLEKMAQPSHPCVKPGLHNRQFFFLSFPSSRLGCLALARAPKPVWPPDDTACPLTGVFVINVYLLKVSFAAIFVSWMKVGRVNQLNILFH